MVGKSTFSSSSHPQLASWFLDLHDQGRLDLNPPYQRRSVWNLEYKRYFVDTVIHQYPAPPIFLEVDVDPDEGKTTYSVIDGKQRLTALLEFVADAFTTPESLKSLGIGGKYFSELSPEDRTAIYSYNFRVELIDTCSPNELNEVFDRLNRNVARLNNQELRHARYGGAFISRAESLADSDFWQQVGVATRARVARMLDVELVSELYVAAMHGAQDGKDYLDDYYADYDDEIPDVAATDLVFENAVEYLKRLDEALHIKQTRYSNAADFYSLWVAIVSTANDSTLPVPAMAAQGLLDFAKEVDAVEDDELAEPTTSATRYLLSARQGSNKRPNRLLRAQVLAAAMGIKADL